MAKTKPTLDVQDTTEAQDAQIERLYAGQKSVGKQDLYHATAFTWLEMKELGHVNRMVLLIEKFHPEDVVLAVVDVATGDGVWCEPEQVVAIGPKLSAPNAPLSHLFKTKASTSAKEANSRRKKFRQELLSEDPESTRAKYARIAKSMVSVAKRDKRKRKTDAFPWSDDFKDNVAEIFANSTKYTPRQIARVVNRMVAETIKKNSRGWIFVNPSAGSIQPQVAENGNLRVTYYLDAAPKPARDRTIAEQAYDESGNELIELLNPIGLEGIEPKSRSITLSFMSRSDLLDEDS